MGVRAVDTITACVIVLAFPATGAWISPPHPSWRALLDKRARALPEVLRAHDAFLPFRGQPSERRIVEIESLPRDHQAFPYGERRIACDRPCEFERRQQRPLFR